MKNKAICKSLISMAAVGLLCIGSMNTVLAVDDLPITIDSTLSAWLHAWGSAFQSMTFDDPEGALKVEQTWTGSAADCYVCGTVAGCNGWLGCGPAIDGTKYASVELDIKWDPASTLNAGLQIGFDHGYAGTYLTNWYSPPLDGTWHHLSLAIPPSANGIDNFLAVAFYRWQPDETSGTSTFWVKNIVIKAKIVPVPPPTLVSPEPIRNTGLWLGMLTGGGGNRDSVYTTVNESPGAAGVSWVGSATAAAPVKYTMTIAQFPDTAKYPGIQAHMFLSSDAASGTGAPEWNSTNAIFFRIANRADGSAYSAFMFKTNADHSWGSNPQQIFGANTLATIDSTTVTGTWSITFTSDTDVRVTTPDNTTTNFTFPAEAAPYFQHAYASFGIQQNNDAYGGQYAVISHVAVENGPMPIDEYFTDLLANNPNLGAAGPPLGTQVVPAGSTWFSKWLLPSTDFNLELSPDLTNWTDAGPTNTWKFDAYGWLPLKQSDLPGTSMNYFRMIKRVPVQLQVLLPGEFNAPGTITGKIGTPDTQVIGTPFDLTIIACDSKFHLAPCTDTVHITSTDAGAYLPYDAALVGGRVVFSMANPFVFGTTGSWSISASDVTTNTVATGTSAVITISQRFRIL